MGMAKLKRLFLLASMAGTLGLVYFLVNTRMDLNIAFPLLKSSSIDSMHRLKSRLTGEGLEGRLKVHCASTQLQNKSSGMKPVWSSERYALDEENLNILKDDAKLDVVRNRFQLREQSLFGWQDFEHLSFPVFRPRIPSIVYHKDTFLVFCEARFDGTKDWGNMMISLRRGVRNGHDVVWEKIRLIASVNGYRTMNPSPMVDKQKDAIVLMFAAFPTDMAFKDLMFFAGQQTSKLLVMKSYDLGITWTEPQDVTGSSIGKIIPFPVLFVPGPGHSIQMECGRLLVPGNYFTNDRNGRNIRGMCNNCTNYAQVLYSDDGGTTWHVGARTPFNYDSNREPIYPNEIQAAELSNGVIYLNARTLHASQPRSHAFSFDGGITLTDLQLVSALQEPGFKRDGLGWVPRAAGGCAASTLAFPAPPGVHTPHDKWLLFSNPADNIDRKKLAIRLSVDGGQSWSEPWVVVTGKAGYSDLVYFEEKDFEGRVQQYFALVYEGGTRQYNEEVRIQIFNLEALLHGLLNIKEHR